MTTLKSVSKDQSQSLISTLKTRFEANIHRHAGIEWSQVAKKLEMNPIKLAIIEQMEKTGGEPDVV